MADLSFSDALAMLKRGSRVQRAGWNGKGMWIVLVPGRSWDVDGAYSRHLETGKTTLLPWIGMLTADGSFVPWLASQTDILADDWIVVA